MEQIFSVEKTRQYRFVVDCLKMTAFRGFQNETEIHFEPDLTVFIAQNGGGKSTVLDALYEHLRILAQATFLPETYESSLSGKDVNMNLDTFSEMGADFILDYIDFDELENAEPDQGSAFIEYLGKPIHTSFFINKEAGIQDRRIDDEESSLQSIRAFNRLKPDLRNLPVFKYYQPGEQSSKTTRKDFNDITSWMERCQKMAYQAADKKYESRLGWLKNAVAEILQDKEYEYSNFEVKYTETGDILRLQKKLKSSAEDSHHFSIDQLSSGERALIGMVADLAIALIENNPNYNRNPLEEGFGIVLIDEVDVHLHPEWQLTVINKLRTIFPKIQFIVSSHSPLVLSSVTSRQVRYLADNHLYGIDEVYGRDAAYIIKVIMGVPNSSVAEEVEAIGKKITQNKLEEAEQGLQKLIDNINDQGEDGENHPDVLKLNGLLTRKKVLSR